MSSFTTHLLIPVLLVLATRLVPTRTVLLWAPFTVVPDLDTAINLLTYHASGGSQALLLHRAALHNVFIIVPSLVAAILLWRRMLRARPALADAAWRTRWDAFGATPWGHPMVLITVFLASHVLLDMFQGGVTPLWPLLDVYVYPRLFILVDMQTGLPSIAASVRTGAGTPTLSRAYPWLTPEEIAIWILVALAWLAVLWYNSWWARGEKPLEVDDDR